MGTCAAVLGALAAGSATALEHVRFVSPEGTTQEATGRVLVEAQDGGLLLEATDGRIWTILPDQLQARSSDENEFRYLNRGKLAAVVMNELPDGFRIHETAHYLICYNTSRAYAQWCGALFERLHRAFFSFWRRQGMTLTEPPVLVALVLRDRDSYVAYGRDELGNAAGSIIGYYSLATNRITTYDLTGIEQLRQPGDRTGSTKAIQQILSRPSAARTVATVIHEATHQLAFNSGLQRRYADNPLWLSEGLAIYFESPDLTSSRGWRGIGGLHTMRLQTMLGYLPARPQDSLLSLLADDRRLRDIRQADIAYAESWSLCYFLMRQRKEQFTAYLQHLAAKPVLGSDGPEQRVAEFERFFGQNWQQLDADFVRSIPSWR